MSNEAV